MGILGTVSLSICSEETDTKDTDCPVGYLAEVLKDIM